MSYRDWESSLRKRNSVRVLSVPTESPLSLWRSSRQGQRTASVWSRRDASIRAPRGLAQWQPLPRPPSLQYHFNALHIMAGLVRWGVPRTWALAVARCWEHVSRRWLYATRR